MSSLADGSSTLLEFIKTNQDALAAHENGDLQFLFKVLSVQKALSVQVHPTNVKKTNFDNIL
jgi:mannose-6-phosphate isomerase class I